MVGFYGVYDMLAQWQHDLLARPRDNIGQKFLGAAPHTDRKVFFESSPISYATADRNSTRFLLVHGTDDDIVDPPTQSVAFLNALTQAGFLCARVVIPAPGISSSPIRWTTPASAVSPARACCAFFRTLSSERGAANNSRAGLRQPSRSKSR